MRPTEQDGHIIYDGPDGPNVVETDAVLTNSEHLVRDLLAGDLTDTDQISTLIRARLPKDPALAIVQLMDTVQVLCASLDVTLTLAGDDAGPVRRGLARGLTHHQNNTEETNR